MDQQLIYVATRNRSVCCNPESAESIKSANETLALSTNGDDQHTNEKATIPGLSKLWFDPKAITNSFCLTELEKKLSYL